MPTPTDRFALDTYDPGESWDHTDTVQFLDEIAVARDTVANRPTSGTYDGEIFFATDEEIFYQWDGTNTQWNEVLNAPTQAEFDSHSTRHESGGADEIPLNNLDLPAGAQIDEDGGDLVVRDSGGSIVLRRDEGAGTWDFVSGDLVNITSLEADKATVSNETLIYRGLTDSDQQTFASATSTTVSFSDGQQDQLGEWDATNDQFSPNSSGWFDLSASVLLNGGGTSDRVLIIIQNVTDGTAVATRAAGGIDTSGTGHNVAISGVFNFGSSKNYEIRVQNADSSDRIWDTPGYLSIRSVFA